MLAISKTTLRDLGLSDIPYVIGSIQVRLPGSENAFAMGRGPHYPSHLFTMYATTCLLSDLAY